MSLNDSLTVAMKRNYLNAKDSEYDKERAADKNDVSYWTQRRQQRHYNQLEARSSIDYPDTQQRHALAYGLLFLLHTSNIYHLLFTVCSRRIFSTAKYDNIKFY